MFWWLWLACSSDPTDTSDPADSDSTDTDGEIDLPDSPFPLTLQLDGAESLTFDGLTCNHPPNQQLQLTYVPTGGSSWSLRVFVREAFTGAGTYSTDVDVQLFENITGGRYYTADQDSGVSVDIEAVGTNGGHGSFTVGALTSELGEGTLSPLPVPIWCEEIVEE